MSSAELTAGKGVLVLLIGVFSVSWAAILIRLSTSEPATIAFFRMFFSALMVSFTIPFHKGRWFAQRRDLYITLLSGLFLGLHFYTWVAGLKITSISSSVVLVTTQPIFVALLGYIFLREKVGGFGLAAIALAIVGTSLVARGDLKIDAAHLRGDILSLLGAFAAGCYLFLGRFVRPRVDLIPYVVVVYSVSALALLLLGVIFQTLAAPARNLDYLIFFLLAAGPTILGHNLYNYALRHLPAFPVGISILGEPVLATIWAMLVFHEFPIGATIIGGLIIISAIVLVMSRMKVAPEAAA